MSSPEIQPAKKIRLSYLEASTVPSIESNVDGAQENLDVIGQDVTGRSERNKVMIEQEVGLTEYVDASVNLGLFFLLRFADFLVYEIDKLGNVVHLTNLDVPKITKADDNLEEQTKESLSNNEITEPVISLDSIFVEMNSLIDEETTKLVQNLLNSNGKDPPFVEIKPENDKEKRRNIHEFFKKHFGNVLNTETKEKAIRVSMHTSKTRNDRRNKRRDDHWEALGGTHCQFVLYKENRSTMEAINFLCKTLKLHARVFNYPGTKDLRAISVQKVTANRVKAERLAGLNSHLRDMKLGNFEYVKEELKLGDLNGNHFVITLRDVKADSEDIITRAMNALKDNGFINYFGMQRFGTTSIMTHEIGRALLQNNWEEAVDLILKPRPGDRSDYQKARQIWAESRDAKKTLELFSKKCIAECHILSSFVKAGNNKDCAGAFNTIPRNLRLMYVHAYQSYVWNKMVSERIRIFGCDVPVVGDLIVLDGDDSIDTEDSISDLASGESSTTGSGNKKDIKVKVLTEEDLPNYTIYDVVLPLPGHSVIYPDNIIFQKYKELMWKDRLDPREMKRNVKDLSLTGSYRKIIGKPKDVFWKTFRYNDPKIPLALNDLEVLQGKSEPESIPDGAYLALRVHISLSTSQYATMALRELLKNSASTELTYTSTEAL
ncbi:10183_t:CDS:10 [Acaulospora morrowiae]|uniref:10183_t:CDS:1 n=1 Tax=Acaulospora morrowiae TaxID=94023 RepID=A0A9N8ZF96_9GLOM|nr:10183_t:CDS:10 [Acaulospora morrowiae]